MDLRRWRQWRQWRRWRRWPLRSIRKSQQTWVLIFFQLLTSEPLSSWWPLMMITSTAKLWRLSFTLSFWGWGGFNLIHPSSLIFNFWTMTSRLVGCLGKHQDRHQTHFHLKDWGRGRGVPQAEASQARRHFCETCHSCGRPRLWRKRQRDLRLRAEGLSAKPPLYNPSLCAGPHPRPCTHP